MKIPQFWVKESLIEEDHKGRKHKAIATGWSFISMEEAKAEAEKRAKKLMERLISADFFNGDSYYLERPIREEIIDEIVVDAEQVAIISRNSYGAIILNAVGAMFVDVDFPEQKRSKGLFGLFRKKQAILDPAEETISGINAWAEQNPSKSFRLYRTAAGLRLLFTDKNYQPKSAEVKQLMQSVGADPMYLKLCLAQECFRARLTPKPWRFGFSRPPYQFPFIDQAAQEKNRIWEAEYSKKIDNFATAKLIAEYGQAASNNKLKAVIAYHDEIVKIDSQQKLA